MPPSDALVLPPPPARIAGRLHPAALVLRPVGQLVPVVLLVVAGRFPLGLAVLVLAASATAGLIRWLRFSWRVEGGTFVVEHGMLTRQRRVIPLDRIQRVDLSRSIRHRLLGVVELRVEAVGGREAEGRLEALAPQDAQALRRALLRGEVEAAPAAGGDALVALAPRQLLVAGLTGGRVGVVAALFGLADQLFGDVVGRLLERLPLLGARSTVLLVVIGVVVVFVLAVAATMVGNWGFTLTAEGDALRIRRGLLQQRLDTVPLRRVQTVRVEENVVRRALGLARVTVEVAGQAGQKEGRETNTLLPIGSRAEAARLVGHILDRPGLADVDLAPMPPAARRRRLGWALAAAAATTAGAAVSAGPAGLLAALVVVPLALLALAAYRSLGHAQVPGFVIARSGVLLRRTAFVPVDRLQVVALRAGPGQRRLRLATLRLHVARSPAGRDPALVDLAVDDARALLAQLSHPREIVHR